MRRKYLLFSAMLVLTMLLSSCALLPEEEEIRTSPVVREYVQEEYETVVVKRGDLVSTERVSARYVPVQKESLTFQLIDEYVDKMLVQVGEYVEKGQLLGQLRVDDIEERIAAAGSEVKELELRRAYLEEEYALALRRMEITTAQMSRSDAREALLDLEEEFDARRDALNDALEIQRLTLDTLEEDLAKRQIRAPFSGTVTFVREYEDGHRTSYAETAVTVADSTRTMFRGETKNWDKFAVGEKYEITVGSDVHLLEVVDEETLGIAAKEKTPGERGYVYFLLTEPAAGLEDGDSGSVQLELQRLENVLYVPVKAVITAGELSLVYYQNEVGLKAYKEVEVGAKIGQNLEIISGLTEGEEIIVG